MVCAGLIFGFASLGILHSNNLNDLEIDHQRGARTIANQIGFKRSQKYFSFIYFSILAVGVVAALLGGVPAWFSLAPGVAGIKVLQMVNRVKQASGPLSPAINMIRFEAAQVHLLMGAGYLVILFLAEAIRRF